MQHDSIDERGWLFSPQPSPPVVARLHVLALARLAVYLPTVLVGLVIAVLISEPSGVPVTLPIIALNMVVMTIGIALLVAARSDHIRPAHAEAVIALVWLFAPVNTIVSMALTNVPTLTLMMMIELASLPIFICTRWALAVSTPFVASAIPLMIRADTNPAFIVAVIGVWIVGIMMQMVLRRATLRAENHRHHLMSALRELEVELAERKRAEAEREALRDQFIHAQRMEAVGTLSAGLAHDMNNILGGILAFAQILRAEAKDPRMQADLDRVRQEAERGAALTRGLLAFSRRGSYRRRPVALANVLDEMTPLLRTLGKGIVIERHDGDAAVVDGDPAQLGQVLFNLCRNAADAMNGEGTITIRTSATEHRGAPHVKLAVSDTGTGMDEATRKRMFEPFFTTKPVGKGTGLGLAMVYGAVEAHGGSLDVHTAAGKGTTIDVLLPTTSSQPRVEKRARSQPSVQRGHVLIIDDDETMRTGTARLLENIGLTPIVAASGARALELFDQRANDITIVVLDMVMPELDGPATYRALRERSNVPVLLISGYTEHAAAQALLAAGAEGFLEKPFTAEQIAAEIDRILGRRKTSEIAVAR